MAPAPRVGQAAVGIPALDACIAVPSGTYVLGEPGEERRVPLRAVRLGRWPVVNEHVRRFVAATGRRVPALLGAKLADRQLADHPATDMSLPDAEAFCAWAGDELGADVRLPTGDEWEAAARGQDGRPWPWGEVFDSERCACAEAGWGWTVPVTAHPGGAGPFGAEQLAGNVWEWVGAANADGWGSVRGGSYLDHAWGVRSSRVLPADAARPTPTTGFRIAIEVCPERSSTP